MTGFIIFFLYFTLFIVFSAFQIVKGRNDLKNDRGARWHNRLRILFGAIILSWNIFLLLILVLNYKR